MDYSHFLGERFCEQVSQGNEHVLNYIVRTSKLFDHHVAKFYRGTTVKSIEFAKAASPQVPGQWDEEYMKRLDELGSLAEQMSKECFQKVVTHLKVKGEYSHQQDQEIKRVIQYKLSALYAVSSTPGAISEKLKKVVIEEFQKPNQLPTQEFEEHLIAEFNALNDYYNKQHETIMKKNHDVLKATP